MTREDIQNIKDLVVCSFYHKNPNPTKFQDQDVDKALREEIAALTSDYYTFQKNKYDLFELLSEAYTEILPKQIEQFMETFADVRTVPKNQKAVFTVKRGRRRAKQFITQVALSGVYEQFRLDNDTFEVGGRAIGGAGWIDFERYSTGDEIVTETIDILYEGFREAVYGEIQKALLASVNADNRPAKNKHIGAGFDATAMQNLCNVAQTYGTGAVIYATPEFVTAMGPDAIGMPVYAPYALTASPTAGSAPGYATPVYNPRNIQEIAEYGRIKTFRGFPIVEIPQSFTDETNTTTVSNPAAAYIFPTGKEKPVKVVFEGPIQFDDFKNRDRSMEFEIYGRVGVAILTNYDWCVYVNTDLMDQTAYPTKYTLDI